MRANERKLKSLILYIIENYNNSKLTETKLQKLLYFCDFNHYAEYGKSITGFTYHKNHFGPTIKSLRSVILELEQEGFLSIIRQTNPYGTPQTNFAITKITQSDFEVSEKLVIDKVNSTYGKLTPRDISALSHLDPPYVVAEDQEEIEYDSVIYRNEENEETPDEEAQKFFEDSKLTDLLSAK